ncbi:phosphoribosylamine--glycine ligase [Longibacter salinarum]|uniref:Phosphoribosylamine--glycine ligase n=1 Tax=Longibacter salinarum TaxID=1850348 RepID=A0A2A8D2B1_9BACT|nr:phosphoribosylamine--glycine ligase [Longibacter salinarum]PEN15021.1 phosphoribosylamine--glycine ligase [Longibacter salinarum]
MRILVIGSGGREHALVNALHRSPSATKLFAAPGNPGTQSKAENVRLNTQDVDAVANWAQRHEIDLVVVGPEKPLVAGLVDRLEEEGIPAFGPSAAAARLEGSKAFAKAFMKEHDVPTAAFRVFSSDAYDEAAAYLDEVGAPVVVKASGLAGGKGAIVCSTLDEAHAALERIINDKDFGTAGDEVVIEEFMEGVEVSVFAITDGEHYALLPPSQDHKAIGEGGTGPNTGGMGAYAPAPMMTGRLLTRVCREIIEPTLKGMSDAGSPYRGLLYCGLMLAEDGPKVVEFNCRFGDPEAQVVLPLLDVDLADVLAKTARGELRNVAIRASARHAACVVLASDGYPVDYETGFEITGIDKANAMEDVDVIHAGTGRRTDGATVTAGGRVLNVVGYGDTLQAALDRAYAAADVVDFKGKTLRRDIGRHAR